MTLHWIRHHKLEDWLRQHHKLLATGDAILLTNTAISQLPPEAPCAQPLHALSDEVIQPLPAYVNLIDDAQWLNLVLKYDHQITW